MKRVSALLLIALAFSLLGSAPAMATPIYSVGNRVHGWSGQTGIHDAFLDEIQPLFTARCVACHGCYEAPCQANFQSYEGIRRGFNPEPIYGSRRTRPTYPTRIEDASTVEQWRAKGFLPVVTGEEEPDGEDRPGNGNPQRSLVYRFLEESQRHNQPGFDASSLRSLQKALDDDKNVCVATESQMDAHFRRSNPWKAVSFERFLAANPMAGMPLGLPRLNPAEAEKLNRWIETGAKGPSAEAQRILETPGRPEVLAKWENEFLNAGSVRSRISARYVYEHLFTAAVAFEEIPGEYYQLVRSRTDSGRIDEIVTDLPYGAPGVSRVYYRFKKFTQAVAQKTQILWRVNDAKLTHLKKLFLDGDGWPSNLSEPGYESSNPFEFFSQIPGTVRARFMIENAKVIIGAMVQGSVCIGSRATYAISDHFWVWFLKPESDVSALQPKLGLPNWNALGMAPVASDDVKPTTQKHSFITELTAQLRQHGITGKEAAAAIHHFLRTVKGNHVYQEAYERTLRTWLKSRNRNGLSLDDVWHGEGGDPMFANGKNANAWLNVTRHELSSTVQFGEEGGAPDSIWVLSYSNFERLYYNLVTSFKSWGSIQHRLATWRGMSYIGLEGEDLAISFMPAEHREAIRARFARGLLGAIKEKAFFPHYSLVPMFSTPGKFLNHFRRYDLPARQHETPGVHGSNPDESVRLLVEKAKGYLAHVAAPAAQAVAENRRQAESALLPLMSKDLRHNGARYPQFMPNITYVRLVTASGGSWVYTIIADRGYKAHNIVFLEDLNREPESDSLSLYRGLIGAYPNAFLEVPAARAGELASALGAIRSESGFKSFASTWGIARNSERFWPFFDWLHAWKAQPLPENDPDTQGVADLSQYLYF